MHRQSVEKRGARRQAASPAAGGRGMSLFEVLCVAALIGIVALVAVSRSGRGAGEPAARGAAGAPAQGARAASADGGRVGGGTWEGGASGPGVEVAPVHREPDLAAGRPGREDDPVNLQRITRQAPAVAAADAPAEARRRDRETAGARPAAVSAAPGSGMIREGPLAGRAVSDVLREAMSSGDLRPLDDPRVQQAMSTDDIKAALSGVVQGMPWSPEAERMVQQLVGRWGQVEPAAALAYAMQLDTRRTRDSSIGRVLDDWAKRDPSAAYDWFAGHYGDSAKFLGSQIPSLFRQMAAADPAWAVSKVSDLGSADLKSAALKSIFSKYVNQGGGNDMTALYNRLPPGDDRRAGAGAIVQLWTPYQPERAAEWVRSIPDADLQTSCYRQLVGVWASQSPSQAAEWLTRQPEGDFWSQEMGRVVQVWARDNPVAASEWLMAQHPPSRQLDPAVSTFAQSISRSDPRTAMSWARTISEPQQREQVMVQVGRQWLKTDPGAATGYLLNAGLSPEAQRRLFPRK